jgi:ribosomal RNA assembly protein
MSFDQSVRVPMERVAVLIGKGGETKKRLEEMCHVSLEIDGKDVNVRVRSTDAVEGDPFKALNVIEAVARGFSPQRALRLLDEDSMLEIIDLRDFAGKSEDSLERIRGRIIGLHGKSRRVIEQLTHCHISVFGRTVAIIGVASEVALAKDAITKLATGSTHRSIYNSLQKARTKRKMERILLWEEQSPEPTEIP